MQRHDGLELTRIGGAVALPAIFHDLGADFAALLARLDLNPKIFAEPENVVPFLMLANLLEQSALATRCDHIGLLVGQGSSAATLGYLGLLVENSPNLRTALDNLIRYFHVHDGRGVPLLEVSKGTVSLGYAVFD
ncbi:MAG: AraC family transcriptional regulator ligand-binding domain-containing protein, partial [Hyphomicrobiales bacterium]|nr:AraC family transcriptional regulator ligand-binding domain-containing protein [Hyphomicrobiales bacterium]